MPATVEVRLKLVSCSNAAATAAGLQSAFCCRCLFSCCCCCWPPELILLLKLFHLSPVRESGGANCMAICSRFGLIIASRRSGSRTARRFFRRSDFKFSASAETRAQTRTLPGQPKLSSLADLFSFSQRPSLFAILDSQFAIRSRSRCLSRLVKLEKWSSRTVRLCQSVKMSMSRPVAQKGRGKQELCSFVGAASEVLELHSSCVESLSLISQQPAAGSFGVSSRRASTHCMLTRREQIREPNESEDPRQLSAGGRAAS